VSGPPVTSRLLLEADAAALLATCAIDYVAHGVAATAEDAAAVAEGLGYPVVLKVVSPDIVHKSDVGGVVVGLPDAAAVRNGFDALMARVHERAPRARLQGALVGRQVTDGIQMIVGAVRDATFGPTVMVGLGGVLTEVLGDVAFRVAPLHVDEARDMLRELRGFRMLTGYRGSPVADLDALAGLAVRLGDLMCDRPDISEVDLNPVVALADGCVALDARIILSEGGPASPACRSQAGATTPTRETTT
jgi:hypothetical protein